MFPAVTAKEKVDTLAVIITANGQDHFLGFSQFAGSYGDDMAAAIYNLLAKNQRLGTIEAVCAVIPLRQILEK